MNDSYPKLFRFTSDGLALFGRVMTGEVDEGALDPVNPVYAQPLEGSFPFEISKFATAKEMAQAVCRSLGSQSPQALAGDTGLWSWITFVLADVLFPKSGGVRQLGELHRWLPAPPNNWQKAQRHLVRMPVLLLHSLGNDADHLICGPPSKGGEVREQLTSQQDMFSANFQRACRVLYFDDLKGTNKRGAGSKGPGVPRRLAVVRQQLDVTWDMTDLSTERILELLPAEFDKYKPKKAQV